MSSRKPLALNTVAIHKLWREYDELDLIVDVCLPGALLVRGIVEGA